MSEKKMVAPVPEERLALRTGDKITFSLQMHDGGMEAKVIVERAADEPASADPLSD